MGSLGVLLIAKQKDVIKSVSQVLNLIDGTNFRISDKVRAKILEQAGEK